MFISLQELYPINNINKQQNIIYHNSFTSPSNTVYSYIEKTNKKLYNLKTKINFSKW